MSTSFSLVQFKFYICHNILKLYCYILRFFVLDCLTGTTPRFIRFIVWWFWVFFYKTINDNKRSPFVCLHSYDYEEDQS